jgi:hypothetical protein
LTKPKINSVQSEQPVPDSEDLTKKELFQVFNLFTAVAKLLEGESRIAAHAKTRTRKISGETKLPRHLNRALIYAETWNERDLLCRRLAAFCYDLAKSFLAAKDPKNALKWMNLAARLLKLSMDPKKQYQEEQIERLYDMVEEIQEHRKESEKVP